MVERLEIRNGKGKLIESELTAMTEADAIKRVKELASGDEKTSYELVRISTVYDSANPPVEIEF